MARRTQRRRRQQKGGAWTFDGPAFTASAGVPVEARTSTSDCAEGPRSVPAVVPAGAWTQRGGACGSCAGAWPPVQAGGSSGNGGYGFVLNNDLGKVYGDIAKGSCVLPQRGAGRVRQRKQRGGDSLVRVVDSYPAGYGFGAASVNEIANGTAHFLAPISYGRQCAGRRRTQRRRGSRRRYRSQKKQQRRR
jgi:hypothetical protein